MKLLASLGEGLAPRYRSSIPAGFALALVAGVVGAAEQERFTYFRSLEGTAQLTSNDGSQAEAEVNYPILVGDRLVLGDDGRADVLLADGSQLTVDGGSELVFEDLAYSAEGDAKGNVLRLLRGRIALDSHGAWTGDLDMPIVDAENARIYLQRNGAYLITARGEGQTEVTVRSGYAEIVDQRGSSIVRTGESVEIVGTDSPRAELLAARPETGIEAWAREQEARHNRGSDPSLDEPVESTATLAEHGEWVDDDNRRAWRPYVSGNSWRPYYNGRWAYTPRGLYWVSGDPWSPVTYHYGAWEYDLHYGWLWYPASVWAPAHVYWYWGPSYTGWMPIGYYSRYYRPYYPGFGLHWGIYGWAGGSWDPFYNWTFCHTNYFWNRYPHHYYGYGRDFAHHGGLARGILTTDTGHLDRRQFGRPELVHTALERGWKPRVAGDRLPDANPFVAGQGELPESVERQVLLKPNPTGRGFDERVAAVLPRSGRDSGSSGSSAGADGAAGVSARQNLQPGPAGADAAGGQALTSQNQVDRRVLSRQGGDGSPGERSAAAPGVDTAGTGSRAASSRPTVSREVSPTPDAQAAPASEPGARSSGVRAVVPRERPSGATPSDAAQTGATRTAVPRAEGSTPGAQRQSVGTPREPARRVLDGIRGRSRPTTASGASPGAAGGGTGPSRATVSRSPVPGASAVPASSSGATSGTPARQRVTRETGNGSPSSTSASPARRPVTSSPPPNRSVSVNERSSGSRAPVARGGGQSPSGASQPSYSTPSRSTSSTYSRGPRPAVSTRAATPGAGSRPSVSTSTPSRSTSPTYSRAPRAAAPPGVTTRSAGSRPAVSTSTPSRSTSSTYAVPRATAPSRAVSPSYGSRPSYSAPARATSPSASSRPSYSRPAGSSAAASRPTVSRSSSPSSVSRPSASGSHSGGSTRATTASPRTSGGASSSRATGSSSRGSSRGSGVRGSSGIR